MPTFWKNWLVWNKPTKTKKPPNPEDKAWTAFSDLIRLRDCLATIGSDKAGRCVTCNTIISRKGNDAGHFISRGATSIKYHPLNVHMQCKTCNRFQQGKWAEYMDFMEREYGREVVDSLRASKSDIVKEFVDWTERAAYFREVRKAIERAYSEGKYGRTQEQVKKYVSKLRKLWDFDAFLLHEE